MGYFKRTCCLLHWADGVYALECDTQQKPNKKSILNI